MRCGNFLARKNAEIQTPVAVADHGQRRQLPAVGDRRQHPHQIQGAAIFGDDAEAGSSAARSHLGTAAVSGRGGDAISSGVYAGPAAERWVSGNSGWGGRSSWRAASGGLDPVPADRRRLEGRFGDSGISAADSSAFSVYWRPGGFRLPGARGADCRPGDAGDRIEWEGVYPAAICLCLRGSGDYVDAHDREQARPDCDDSGDAVHDLLGADSDLSVDHCGVYSESPAAGRLFWDARGGDAGACICWVLWRRW